VGTIQSSVQYPGHARPVVSEARGLVALDAAAASLPLANRTPPPHPLSPSTAYDVRGAAGVICSVLT